LDLVHVIVLAVLQGVTEFLPISSSAHLILLPKLFGWEDQGLLIDVAVHLGTLGAVVLYFSKDILAMIIGVFKFMLGRRNPSATLAGQIFIASLPVLTAGYFMQDIVSNYLRSMVLIGWSSLVFGIILFFSDKLSLTVKKLSHLTYFDAIVIGFAQVLALIPGASRSGTAITAARLLGYERSDSAIFSMLLSIPTIIATGFWLTISLRSAEDIELNATVFTSMAISFFVALLAISALMSWLRRSNYNIFVFYRIILGIFLLAIGYDWI